MAQLSHLYMTTGKNYNFNYLDLCQQADVSHYGDLEAKGNDGSSLTCTNRGKSTKGGSCIKHISVRFISVAQSCLTLCDPMDRSTPPPCPAPTPGVYSNSCPSSQWCHPAISSSVVPFPPAPNPSQHQGLFQWVSSLQEVAKVLEFQIQNQELPSLHWLMTRYLQRSTSNNLPSHIKAKWTFIIY